MTAPTIEQFLAQPSTDEDDHEELQEETTLLGIDPLISIAESLRQMVDVFTGGGGPAQLIGQLEAEVHEIEAMHDAKQALIEETLAICAKSTSKLANSIRAVLEPVVVPEAPTDEPAPEPISSEGPSHPAHDADVDEWRAYALSQGCTEADLEGANRSRIRTLLGITQPVG